MSSVRIFDQQIVEKFKSNLLSAIKKCDEFNVKRIISSPRSVGDAVGGIVSEQFVNCYPENLICDYQINSSRRAMANASFKDKEDNFFAVDIITHNKSADFNMPNITSVDRLTTFYDNDKNYFVILVVQYEISDGKINFTNIHFFPIEKLSWDCLTLGALGWGQLQIADTNNIILEQGQQRKEWMLRLCETLDSFYIHEIEKIGHRQERFLQTKQKWQNKG